MKEDKGKPLYMISVVAKMLDVHPQTLRLYEREGLVRPSRTEGKTRMYSEEDIQRLEVVLRLTRDLGINLVGVSAVLGLREQLETLRRNMELFARSLCVDFESQIPDVRKKVLKALEKASLGEVVNLEHK